MTQKASLSVNALRLFIRTHRIKTVISPQKLAVEHRNPLVPQAVGDVIEELVDKGFLVPARGGWKRTAKPLTDEMRRSLQIAVRTRQRKKEIERDPNAPVNVVRNDLESWYAELFGYPQHTILLTGRVHRLEG